ncbi:hypothetical protein ACE1SV_09300 [Streptomyces sp. E-15]
MSDRRRDTPDPSPSPAPRRGTPEGPALAGPSPRGGRRSGAGGATRSVLALAVAYVRVVHRRTRRVRERSRRGR